MDPTTAFVTIVVAALVAFPLVFAQWVQWRQGQRIEHATTAIKSETSAIHKQTNSQLDSLKAEIVVLNGQLAPLKAEVVSLVHQLAASHILLTTARDEIVRLTRVLEHPKYRRLEPEG